MKKVLLFSMFIVLTAASMVQAGSEADTTFKVTKGTLCLFGRMYRGPDVSFRVSGMHLYVDTPAGPVILQELPDPDAPRPPVPAEVVAQARFQDAVDDTVRRMMSQKCSRDVMNARLKAAFQSSLVDSVIMSPDPGIVGIYWRGERGPEIDEVGPISQGPPVDQKAALRHGLIFYAKSIVTTLDDDALVFLLKPTPAYAMPPELAFTDEFKKREALIEVVQALQGRTDRLRLLTRPFIDELQRQSGGRGK